MNRPLCFVLMPFGKKPNIAGTLIDFDEVYQKLIRPAIQEADLEPLRADEEMTGGIIHKPMFERLILCEYAIADLTTANANVFYELGIRHAVREWSTITIFAEGGGQLPFDVVSLRAIPYQLTPQGTPDNILSVRNIMARRLHDAQQATRDSPIYQLVEGFPEVSHTKTDVFRDRVEYSKLMKARLREARQQGLETLKNLACELQPIASCDSGVVIDLYLSYRGVKGWQEMIDMVSQMAPPLVNTVMVQEQLGFALNRLGKSEEAEEVLTELIRVRGASSETYGILGRVYKDRWEAVHDAGETFQAHGLLNQAIEAYLRGFEADWRDAYPGINAVTLMELKDPPDPRREQLLPVVAYAVERRMAGGIPDYWDHATRLELAVLGKQEQQATEAAHAALAVMRETWEAETTARNLRLIQEARDKRNETILWADKILTELERKAHDNPGSSVL
ncbi:TRAFs-binding domain-containing protein [Candidatus Nitrospira salsa]